MYLYISIVLVLLVYCAEAQQRRTPPQDHECFQKSVCAGKIDPDKYHAHTDDKYFYSCFHWDLQYLGLGILTFNLGCQICPNRDTYFSEYCQDCLSRKDVNENNCTDTGEILPGASAPGLRRDCPPENSCTARPNGTYRLGEGPDEQSVFYSCASGDSTECQDCPATLIYVPACGSCEINDTTDPDECPPKPVDGAPLNLCDSDFCNGRADGSYEKADDSSEYYTCLEGTCLIEQCAPGSGVFTAVCGKKCVTTYTKVESECPVASPFIPQQIKFCDPFDFCHGKADGDYEVGDSLEYFYKCSYKYCTVQDCPPGLVYVNDVGYCDYTA